MEPSSSNDFSQSYFESRFSYATAREAVWREICRYLGRYTRPDARVLDLGAGYCSFINNVTAAKRYAIDLYPDFARYAASSVHTTVGRCDNLTMFASDSLDVVFASNLLEHLSRDALAATLKEVFRVLVPGGRFILLQPNYRYCYREYFDDYTHVLVFSHVSLRDLLIAYGFTIQAIFPRFLPFSFKSRLPAWPWLVRIYLRLPWRPFAKQMLLVGQKPVNTTPTL